jgi:hypothetical protein
MILMSRGILDLNLRIQGIITLVQGPRSFLLFSGIMIPVQGPGSYLLSYPMGTAGWDGETFFSVSHCPDCKWEKEEELLESSTIIQKLS